MWYLQLTAAVVARKCFIQQEENLAAFINGFGELCDPDFKANHAELLASFTEMVNGMKLKVRDFSHPTHSCLFCPTYISHNAVNNHA